MLLDFAAKSRLSELDKHLAKLEWNNFFADSKQPLDIPYMPWQMAEALWLELWYNLEIL